MTTVTTVTISGDDAKVESGTRNSAHGVGDDTELGLCDNLCVLAKKTTNACVFLTSAITLITASIGWTVLLIVLPLIPLAGLIIGAIHKNDCKAENLVPTWLIVWSSTLMMRKIIALGCKQCKDEVRESTWIKAITWIVDLFILVWFFCGSAWVFAIYKPEYDDENSINYCHPTLYIFSFVVQIIVCIMLFALVLLVIVVSLIFTCTCCMICCVGESPPAK